MVAVAYLNRNETIDHSNIAYKDRTLNQQVLLSERLKQLAVVVVEKSKKKPSKKAATIRPQHIVSPIEVNLSKIVRMDFDNIPNYLSKTNPSFDKKIRSILPTTSNLNELRYIAILMYKIMSIDMIRSLWIVYRKSGLGELQTTSPMNQLAIQLWPKEVRSLVKQFKIKDADDDTVCLAFVNTCLRKLDEKSIEYRHELRLKTSRVRDYTQNIEYSIEKFVQQGLISLCIEINCLIALIQYDYTDGLIIHQYLAQNPNQNQIQWMQRLCQLKYDQEFTKHEMNSLKEQILSYIASDSFEREPIRQSIFINSIDDIDIRQQLLTQYTNVTQQARINMMTVYLKSAEAHMHQCDKQFNIEKDEINQINQFLPLDQQLTSTMENLIDQRLTIIIACFKRIHTFKTELIYVKSNIH